MKKKKPKIYIPTYKIIILCASVIAICMFLLLVTTLSSDKKQKKEEEAVLTQFEEEKQKQSISISEINTAEKKEILPAKKDTKSTGKKSNQETKADIKIENTVSTNQQNNIEKKSTTESKKEIIPENNINAISDVQSQKTNKTVENINAPKSEAKKEITTSKIEQKNKSEQKINVLSGFNFPQAEKNAQLVFVFDDGGQNMTQLEKFLSLPFPITIAVLPQLVHSKEAADRIRKSGNEVILHQPMQAINSKVNPGPGAITPEMTDDEIISLLFYNINEIGPIEGMNNHEGSAITADAEKMSIILNVASENGIYFLDSRTNAETQVPYVAKEMGYAYYERNIFLDNTKNRADILAEINKGIALANKNGVAIMIGHIWSADILPDLLNEIYPELKQKGYTFSTVSNSKAKKYN